MIKPLAKSVLIPLGLTAVASATDARIYQKNLGSVHNNTITLIISNNEMEDIIKIVISLEDSGLLLKEVTETVQNEVKEQKGGFLTVLLVTGWGISREGKGWRERINRAGEGVKRACYGNNKIDF